MKRIRSLTGLSQAAFSKKYEIPKRTIEDWETGKRTAPAYVLKMLERIVCEDYGIRFVSVDEGEHETDIKVFTNLEDANEWASMIWDHLTEKEQKERSVFVLEVCEDDLEDPEDWGSFSVYRNHPDGGFIR